MRLDELGAHIDRWAEDSAAFGDYTASEGKHVPRLHPSAGVLLKAILNRDVLTLTESRGLLGDNVDATDVVKQLQQHGVLRQDGEALSFVLTLHRAERFLPGLFP